MKKSLMILSILSLLLSCEKENNTIDDKISDPYELPWKTEYVHYENISMCMGSHSSGYELYYKDSLLKEDCADFGGIGIQDSMLINDSILHLFFSGSNGSYVLTTTNGGYAWEKFETGPPSLQKLHYVNTKLTYCVTKNQDDLYFTGIGKSYLSVYHQTFSSGIHYITDQGTEVMNNDSATIEINDSLSFVILF